MSGWWSAPGLVRHHAAAAAASAAIVDSGAVETWADLDRRTDLVATDLLAAGVPAGGVVSFIAEPSVETIATIMGVLRAGAVAAPLPTGLTPTEMAAALNVLEPVLVVGRDTVALDGRTLGGAGAIVLTSGTTARPRGVVLSERALAASADAWLAALPPATGWLLALALGHVAGLGVLWRAVAAGVPTRIAIGSDTDDLLRALDDPIASHVSLVPAQLARILDQARDVRPPATLRAVLLGGGPIPPALVSRAVERGWPVVPTYGLSEAGSGVTALPTTEVRAAPLTAGPPLPGVRVTIDEPDGDGVGEIVVTTPARFSGYVGEAGGDGPIRTGDLGRLDDAGRLTVVDRRAERIVRGGENVSPAEVEAVLLALPGIADAAIVARRDDRLGHVPVAAVVLRTHADDPGDEAILRACRSSLAGFKVPADIVRLDALPRTAGGKLRREAVRALLDDEASGILARPDGDEIGWRLIGDGRPPVLLLPGTLSNCAQLDRLAADLASSLNASVHSIDRRGMGTSRFADPHALDVAVHVHDLVAYLDARRVDRVLVVGVSFGGVVGLELAARHPDRVAALVAWEPPYGALADERTRARFAALAASTAEAHRTGGAPAAAEAFLRAVAGDAAWDRLPERGRAFLAHEGDAALTDSALLGLDPDGLARIDAPTTILTGSLSEPFYPQIADALATRVAGAQRLALDGLGHAAPITEPARVVTAIQSSLAIGARS